MEKYYRVKNTLYASDAMHYLRLLTGAHLYERQLLELIKEGVIHCYIQPANSLLAFDGDNKEVPAFENGPQQIVATVANLIDLHWVYPYNNLGNMQSAVLIFSPYAEHDGSKVLIRRGVSLHGEVDIDLMFMPKKRTWQAVAYSFNEDGEQVFFLRDDIEALAAKMNGMSDTQSMQLEVALLRDEVEQLKEDKQDLFDEINNQPAPQALKKEVASLRAEVERLEAENKGLRKADDPRQIRNMAKAIYGIAVDKYGYNPDLKRNTATSVMSAAAEKKGVQTTRGTIKGYIDQGKQYLDEDGE